MFCMLLPSGFTSDVKLWNVQFTKAGDFHQVTKMMGLTGHRNSVYHCSLSADSTRCVHAYMCVHVRACTQVCGMYACVHA